LVWTKIKVKCDFVFFEYKASKFDNNILLSSLFYFKKKRIKDKKDKERKRKDERR